MFRNSASHLLGAFDLVSNEEDNQLPTSRSGLNCRLGLGDLFMLADEWRPIA